MKLSTLSLLIGIIAIVDSKNVRRRHVKDAHLLKMVQENEEENLNSQKMGNLGKRSVAHQTGDVRARDLQTDGCRVIDQSSGASKQIIAGALPVQTYFIPLPEEKLFTHGFYQINPNKARPPIESLISVSISTDKTVIWYDHWEDTYDTEGKVSVTTEIWGDGNADNGCAPTVDPCTHSNDRLSAGDVVVIQNSVPLPRDKSQIRYDGGDRILASYPIAVTRGAYPAQPGSLMAGAVEVLAQSEWGLTYEAPVGLDVGRAFQAFQYSAFYFMAGEDNTVVTLPNAETLRLNMGEGSMVFVNKSHQIRSNKPIQVDLITGDVWSYYEMRWFSMLSVEKYTASYVSPVGDSFGKTKVLVYNPNEEEISVTVQYLKTYSNGYIQRFQYAIQVPSKQYQLSDVIPTYSGAFLDGTGPFLALSLTDTESTTASGQTTDGQWYDWGFPVIPREKLSSQVLIGWGYGCTQNNCYGQTDRSVVWACPVEDADIYVDFGNTGIPDGKVTLRALQGIRIGDPRDDDMSGAIIFATKAGSGPTGPGVDIAAAWGQDPSVSYQYQGISLDLGTVVLPMSVVQVAKLVDKDVVSAGGQLVYTIRISNVGQSDVKSGELIVKDALDDHVSYLPGSMNFLHDGKSCSISDGTSSSVFPLDGDGFTIPVDLTRRGGFVDIVFTVSVSDNASNETIVNNGHVSYSGTLIPFSATASLAMEASISLVNTVYHGSDNGAQCGGDLPTEHVEVLFGSTATYCLEVRNTGTTLLSEIQIVDENLDFSLTLDGQLAPGESRVHSFERLVLHELENLAEVRGRSTFAKDPDGESLVIVEDNDSSSVSLVAYDPSISLSNTVMVSAGTNDCSLSTDLVVDLLGTGVRYCFVVQNTGNSFLSQVTLENPILNFSTVYDGVLAPGESHLFELDASIVSDMVNTATVTGIPSLADSTKIPDHSIVDDKDTSETRKLVVTPSVSIENTVYLSDPDDTLGGKCGSVDAVDFVAGFYGDIVTYCFRVVNTGDSTLSDIEVVNSNLSFVDSSIDVLEPGEAKTIHVVSSIEGRLSNVATVTATPKLADGRAIPGVSEVTDSDVSEASQRLRDAGIILDNNVYAGTDGGNSCGTTKAHERVEVFMNKPVTYCFAIKNIGETWLNATLINDSLGISRFLGLVAPGVSETIHVESFVSTDLTNLASVSATPVFSNGDVIPNHLDVRDDDDSSVGVLDYAPEISVTNAVYLEADSGALCNTTTPKPKVESTFGSMATYCFLVTNNGNTHLSDVKLLNPAFDLEQTLPTLAPGDSALVTYSSRILTDLVNICTVQGSPSHSDGSLIPVKVVQDSDQSAVARTPFYPSVLLETKVHLRDKDGSSCDNASQNVADIYLTNIEWCFIVKNNGDTFLDNVSVEAGGIEFKQSLDIILAPQESYVFRVPGRILMSMDNSATASANPVLADGTDIIGVDDVDASDAASVQKVTLPAAIALTSWISVGEKLDACDDAKLPTVEVKFGDRLTHCFDVQNIGNSHLSNIKITDKELSFFNSLDWNLQPGETRRVSVTSMARSDRSYVANITATATMSDGRELLDVDEVGASKSTFVKVTPFEPRVVVEAKVYDGPHDDGAQCDKAVDHIEGPRETNITYCVQVENKGDVYLSNVVVTIDDILFETSIEILAPNTSVVVPVPAVIGGDLEAVAKVTAKPTLSDHSEIPNLEDVSARDIATVKEVAHQPGVSVRNTVYLSLTGEVKCGSKEALKTVEGYKGSQISFCFDVINSGNSHLRDIVLTNHELAFSQTIESLSPGQSKMIVYNSAIGSGGSNVIEVSAVPSTKSGMPISGSLVVNASDSSSVSLKEFNPSIVVDNVVFKGHGGIDTCNSTQARELVEGFTGTDVTYCFIIRNQGDTALKSLKVSNEALGYSKALDEILEAGETRTIMLEQVIFSDLTNLMEVEATAVHPSSHHILENHSLVEASDSSMVLVIPLEAGIKVTNLVFVGDEDQCGTDNAVSSVQALFGKNVTYCFEVRNIGDTTLGEISLANDALSYKKSDFGLLSPGESFLVEVGSKLLGDMVNTALVEASPVSESGVLLAGVAKVSSEASSFTKELLPIAQIRIENTVFADDQGVDGCGNATNNASGLYGSTVVYCLKVTNDGETYLNNIEITDDQLNFFDDSIGLLKPKESYIVQVKRPLVQNLQNIASVTGNPCLEDGGDIPSLSDVSSADDSNTNLVAHAPSIELSNNVYVGDDGGESCDTDLPKKYVEAGYLSPVTYCFRIANTGNSFLGNVSLVDEELGFVADEIEQLAPGASTIIAFSYPIKGSMSNKAVVFASPIIENGDKIPELKDVIFSDTSAVGQLAFKASVSIENKLYIGRDLGTSCGTSVAKKSATGMPEDDVVFCFLVKNTGNTFLGEITVENQKLEYSDNSVGILGPDESILVPFQGVLSESMKNVATVTATPVLSNGQAIAEARAVTASDSSDLFLSSDEKLGNKVSVANEGKCLEDIWKMKNSEKLLCASNNEVYLESVSARVPSTCQVGETITVTVDGSIHYSGSRYDVGWYVATDGGDAMEGSCAADGLREGNSYQIKDGMIAWTGDESDGDMCGDVNTVGNGDGHIIDTPIAINLSMPCVDTNDDGALDFAVCLTWSNEPNGSGCSFSDNIPSSAEGGCFCSRYEVKNVAVVTPAQDDVTACK